MRFLARNRQSAESVLRRRGYHRLLGLGLLAGICGGVPAVAYRFVLTWADRARGFLFSLADSPLRIVLLFLGLLLLGLIVGRLVKGEPLISGSGIPQVKAQVLGKLTPPWCRVLVKKFIGGALCILGGLALGREGPSIQLGAMAAQGLSGKLPCSQVERRYMVTCGACGALAAAFNAPLAGMMFGLEEIHKNFSAFALLPTLIAAIAADLISKAFFGTSAVLSLGLAEPVGYMGYLLFAATGVLMGLLGTLYNKTLLSLQRGYKKLPIPAWCRVLIPFLLAGVVGLLWPVLLGPGNNVIQALNAGEYILSATLLLLAGKFLFSLICFSSGAPGGIFFPMLVLGALAGSACGHVAVLAFGLPASCMVDFVVLGMAGLFAGIVRAPITGIVLVLEMSGSLTQLAGIAICACLATLIANLLGSKPIYESLLENLLHDHAEPVSQGNDLISYAIPLESVLAGKALKDIRLPGGSLVIAIVRGTESLIPHGDTVLEPGDLISIACSVQNADQLRHYLRHASAPRSDRSDGGGPSRHP